MKLLYFGANITSRSILRYLILIKLTVVFMATLFLQKSYANTDRRFEDINASSIQQTIEGKVTDENNEPLVGVSVSIKGTTKATTTNLDGVFNIEAQQDDVLSFSYIGFFSKEVLIKNNSLQIVMEEDISALDEVVIVGYGKQKKVNLTGSVASLNVEDIQGRAQANILSSVQGTIPGVTVISRPGQTPTINFRGRGNLGSSSPLYVIDGVISDADVFSNLDPNTIENISFLKDAASSSIYGARAAYGVVLITTKLGKKEGFQVDYNGLVGVKTPTYRTDFVNSWEYAELYNEAKYNTNPTAGKNQGFTDEEIGWFKDGSKPDLYPNTDWIDLIYDDEALTTQHSVNISGRSERNRYFAGIGYLNDKESLKGRDNKRYNLNLNTSSDVTDWMTFTTNIKYTQRTNDVYSGTPSMANMLIVPSTFVAKHSNGDWGSVNAGKEASGTFIGSNPLRAYSNKDWSNSKNENSLFTLGLDIKPVAGLTISGTGTYNRKVGRSKGFTATKEEVPSFLNPGSLISGTGNTLNVMNMNQGNNSLLSFTGTANYLWENDIHSIEGLLGASQEHYQYEALGASRENFPSDNLTDMSAGSTSGPNYQNSSSSSENLMRSYFSRVKYRLHERYLFEVNFRADASSRFAKNARWGYFPSFSAGWRISEEEFMDDTKGWINDLKLRASYGSLGNINNVGNYDYFQNYAAISDYNFDNDPVKGIVESKPSNPQLSWETVAISNIGLDFDLFNNKLSGSLEYYEKRTNDILLAYNVPVETGISRAPSQNIAKVENKGVELSLFHRNTIGEFSYTVGGNLATNKNRIIDLASSNDIIQDMGNGVGKFILRTGSAIGSIYGFETDGLYSQEEIDAGSYYTYGGTTPNAGDIKYLPQREGVEFGDQITDQDRTIIGNDVPSLTYGLNLSAQYKNFEISVAGQGVSNVDVGFEVYQMHPFFHGQDNPRSFHLGRWTEANPNPKAVYPRIYDASSPHTAYNRAFSDYNVFKASYFRIKNISLGYTVPNQMVSKWGLSKTKLFLTGENLFTVRGDKKMKDFDPETAGGVIYAFGVKSVSLGLNVSF